MARGLLRVLACAGLVAVVGAGGTHAAGAPHPSGDGEAAVPTHACVPGLNYPGGDLPNMPVGVTGGGAECAAMCANETRCQVYTYHAAAPCSDHGESCSEAGGCCWLKHTEASSAINKCTCSGRVRVPPGPAPAPPPGARSVLYIIVDDLRPELSVYGRPGHTPNIERLAAGGLTFDRAYCQISVCSPSRMSFLSGRRPGHTRTTNFINHIRQATCGRPANGVASTGTVLRHTAAPKIGSAAGQCCTDCTLAPKCVGWTYNTSAHAPKQGQCTLFSRVQGSAPALEAISGASGQSDMMKWTTLPMAFLHSGYRTCGTGKIFHTEEGGEGPEPWVGEGMPPLQDPPSWTPGCSMQVPNDPAPMRPCPKNGTRFYCTVDADLDGVPADKSVGPLCDKVIGDDALAKLRASKANTDATGQPFLLMVGFRKPHMPFRFPRPYLDLLPPAEDTDVALHPTLDPSIPAIAHWDGPPQASPYEALDKATAQVWRQHYRGAVAWMDHQVGVMLDELEALGLANDTVVMLHSDHGWSLGEDGSWQKFTNFELGARVPLIVRDPALAQSHGKRTGAIAELVDAMPTVLDLAGVPLPAAETFDGVSQRPVLEDPNSPGVKQKALSQYPRCPADLQNRSDFWADNACEFVDRSGYPFMGYSLRDAQWRYTEWAAWNHTSQRPIWTSLAGRELYSHEGDNGTVDFDSFEVTNQAQAHPSVVERLSSALHAAFAAAGAEVSVSSAPDA